MVFKFSPLHFPTVPTTWPVVVAARSRTAAARLLGLWVCIPLGARISVSCECCVLSGRGVCYGLIPRPKKSNREREKKVCACACRRGMECDQVQQ